jgi:transcriptional regulator with PAS, ATPase and Fis domain
MAIALMARDKENMSEGSLLVGTVSERPDQVKTQDHYILLGTAPCMIKVREQILRISASEESVLIVGETGTGKGLAARCIHKLSRLRERIFLAVDCTTLAPSLVESELFGYVKGAFTGAFVSKKGLFEAAHGGTIFLDEIGALTPDMQAKLLWAIEEHQVRPVGGTSWVDFHSRIIAATLSDLETAVQKGSFRSDLYFRVNVLTIILPPLRQRREDIALLANYFLAKHSPPQRDRMDISDEALECLVEYHWPGNVRELENCMRWAIAMGSGPILYAKDLPPQMQKNDRAIHFSDSRVNPLALREVERTAILRALSEAHGDKQLAARLLGVGKTTIYRKLKEYGVS